MDVAFAGIQFCAGCSVNALEGGDLKLNVLISTFSGTYTVPRVEPGDGSPCHFYLQTSHAGAFDYYQFIHCGGTHTSSDRINISLEVGLDRGTGIHGVKNMDVYIDSSVGPGALGVFHHGLPEATDCGSSVVLSNDYVAFSPCTGHEGANIGGGGTATVSFNY